MDKKEKLTKTQLIEKINNERITFKRALEQKDEECARMVAQVRQVADMVIGLMVVAYGNQIGDEYFLDITPPNTPMAVKAERTDIGYRITVKEK